MESCSDVLVCWDAFIFRNYGVYWRQWNPYIKIIRPLKLKSIYHLSLFMANDPRDVRCDLVFLDPGTGSGIWNLGMWASGWGSGILDSKFSIFTSNVWGLERGDAGSWHMGENWEVKVKGKQRKIHPISNKQYYGVSDHWKLMEKEDDY